MSQENVEVVRRGFDAFNRGDYEAWIAGYDEDVEMRDLAKTPDTGVYRGHSGLREWLAKLEDAYAEVRFEVLRLVEAEDAVLADVRAVARGKGSGVLIRMPAHCVYRLRYSRVIWTECFVERAEALKAAGLSE